MTMDSDDWVFYGLLLPGLIVLVLAIMWPMSRHARYSVNTDGFRYSTDAVLVLPSGGIRFVTGTDVHELHCPYEIVDHAPHAEAP